MIGWYVHHHGHGHLHRAVTVAHALVSGSGEQVTGLSSLPAPEGWPGGWMRLPRDDDGVVEAPAAGGSLHWAPLGHPGLRERMAAVSSWIQAHRPRVVVVDVSVEVTLLARLHGVPVVTVAMPGSRDDPPHRLAHDLASAVVAPWPVSASPMVRGLDERSDRVHHVGAISRHGVVDAPARPSRSVVVLFGSGGDDRTSAWLQDARERTPGWTWTVLGGPGGEWVGEPAPVIRGAGVVVTHAGQNAVAEVAAARRPAVVVPQPRPFDEQLATARALSDPRWPAEVLEPGEVPEWPSLLDRVLGLDSRRWAPWCDGQAAARAARIIAGVARGAA